MQPVEQTSKEYFKILKIMHLALLIGLSAFTLIVYLLSINGGIIADNSDLDNLFQYIAPTLIVSGIIASYLIQKNKVNKIKLKTNVIEKLTDYRSAFIIKFALLEAPAFFAIVIFILTANLIYLVYIMPIIILFTLL